MRKPNTEQPEKVAMVEVPSEVLQDIRFLHVSLKAAISLAYEAYDFEGIDLIRVIDPAVERLGAIIEENHFPE